MSWQSVRNKNYDSHDTYYKGECPKFKETARLFIRLSGKTVSKHDLQPTFTPRFIECSLLNEKQEKHTTCMLQCPCFEDYKNSHDY